MRVARSAIVALCALSLVGPSALAQRATPSSSYERALSVPTPGMIRAHTQFLAGDLLEGRAPGTKGGRIAAAYIAAQFEAAGLAPAGLDSTYFQPVSLIGITPQPSLVVGVGRDVFTLDYGDDFVARPENPDSTVTGDADLVFVGYGIQAREWGWDDFKGASLTGKILLMLINDPGLTDASRFEGRTATAYARWTYKLEQAGRAGALGAILIHTDATAPYPWTAVRASWSSEQLMLASRPPSPLRFAAWISEAAVRRLAAASGRDFEALYRRAQQPDFRPIPMGAHAVVHIKSGVRSFEAANVLAKLEGVDSIGRREAVVITSHYDHLGIGAAVRGDSIYNGAEDNASGVATMLAAASGLARAGGLRRSLVFVATTGAEAGSLGAEAYLAQPVVPLELTVAEINLDGGNVRGLTSDVVMLGAEHSDMQSVAAHTAQEAGLALSPDPMPQAGLFYRSDQFSFASSGIPALALRSGTMFVGRPKTWGVDQEHRYLVERYLQPSDAVTEGFDYRGAVQQAQLLIRLGWTLSATTEFFQWNEGTAFRAAGDRLRARRLLTGSPGRMP